MTLNPLTQVASLGQSLWYDNIHRDMLDDGSLAQLVAEDGLRGVTSNPSIFDKAMTGGGSYDAAITRLLSTEPGLSTEALFQHLAVADIRQAADVLAPVHRESGGVDGMVSLEVSPFLARDTAATVSEAIRLHDWIDRPNVMIKVPATREGLPAIEQLTAAGVSVNVTLLFSLDRYREVVDAYLAGLAARVRQGLPLDGIVSVASFFVSRVDTAVDDRLAGEHEALRGQMAIANAKCAYRHFLEVFDGERFRRLRALGACEQRLLWASTGTKNPAYSDVLYVESLIGPRTVNTVPPATLEAFRDHGRADDALTRGMDEAAALLQRLPEAGIDLAAVTDRLEEEGVRAFAEAHAHLLDGLARRADALRVTTARAG